jgi:hypothetical protein
VWEIALPGDALSTPGMNAGARRAFRSAAAGDAPRGVASHASSKTTVGMFWSATREAQLLTFLAMRGEWLRGIVPGKQPDRWSGARKSPVGPERANRWHVSDLLFLGGVARKHPRGSALIAVTQEVRMRCRGPRICRSLAALPLGGRLAAGGDQPGDPNALFRTNARCRTPAHVGGPDQ